MRCGWDLIECQSGLEIVAQSGRDPKLRSEAERYTYTILVELMDDLLRDTGANGCRDADGQLAPLTITRPVCHAVSLDLVFHGHHVVCRSGTLTHIRYRKDETRNALCFGLFGNENVRLVAVLEATSPNMRNLGTTYVSDRVARLDLFLLLQDCIGVFDLAERPAAFFGEHRRRG